MSSNNMHYRYNVEYYDGLNMKEVKGDESKSEFYFSDDKYDKTMHERSNTIINFKFPDCNVFNLPEKELGIRSFNLFSAYPGIMIGIGNLHSISIEGAMQNGFTFDYVTGIPYLPGSSLKGLLKSAFPDKKFFKAKEQYIRSYLKNGKKQVDIKGLKNHIFGSEDEKSPGKGIFYGVFPDVNSADNHRLLTDDYITPHTDEFTNPIPVRMVKIKPDIKFIFKFSCVPYKDEKNDIIITVDDMCDLFQDIILDMGIGAKTNVGYGVMVKVEDKSLLKNDDSELKAKKSKKQTNTKNNKKEPYKGNEQRSNNWQARKK